MLKRKFLIIGEVFVDTHLDIQAEYGSVVRLGGIFHSARGFSSLGIEYALAYYAPTYLESNIKEYAQKLKAQGNFRLGTVTKAPNVMLIKESRETGDQGYENILFRQVEILDDTAFHFRSVQTVQLVLVILLLIQRSVRQTNKGLSGNNYSNFSTET